ncbi:hypothetical protein [Sphingobacterium siyangense]|uniref:hypothetical protein n=1 Tax=Sphingobacterium siyangense TaxID=459529 RepID=UPI00301A2506
MILVLTTRYYEQGTAAVLDWLIANKSRFLVIHYEDLLSKKVSYEVDVINQDVFVDGISIKEEISLIWYRRFYLAEKIFKDAAEGRIRNQLVFEAKSELETLVNYLRYFFKDKPQLPVKPTFGENKLIYLDFAQKAGLRCPQTIVTNSRKVLENFYYRNGENIISKPLYFSMYYSKENISYSVQTTRYDKSMIDDLPSYFFPSLFQQSIESRYEIRVFFLNGKLYSTAAVYDGAGKNIDLKMNYKSPDLHWVVYCLPVEIEQKICSFMGMAKLNTGSLDLLKTDEGYYFLEVNPVGQYLAPSEYCNYYLEYEISQALVYEKKASKIQYSH